MKLQGNSRRQSRSMTSEVGQRDQPSAATETKGGSELTGGRLWRDDPTVQNNPRVAFDAIIGLAKSHGQTRIGAKKRQLAIQDQATVEAVMARTCQLSQSHDRCHNAPLGLSIARRSPVVPGPSNQSRQRNDMFQEREDNVGRKQSADRRGRFQSRQQRPRRGGVDQPIF
jgi:hypothetical protein